VLNIKQLGMLETKFGCTPSKANEIQVYFFSFSSKKLQKNYQMSGKINSYICLMLSVYKSFHQMVKYGWQRNNILHNLTGIEI